MGRRLAGSKSETKPTIAAPRGPVSGIAAPTRIDVNEILALEAESRVDRSADANKAIADRTATGTNSKVGDGPTTNAHIHAQTSAMKTTTVTHQARDMFASYAPGVSVLRGPTPYVPSVSASWSDPN